MEFANRLLWPFFTRMPPFSEEIWQKHVFGVSEGSLICRQAKTRSTEASSFSSSGSKGSSHLTFSPPPPPFVPSLAKKKAAAAAAAALPAKQQLQRSCQEQQLSISTCCRRRWRRSSLDTSCPLSSTNAPLSLQGSQGSKQSH